MFEMKKVLLSLLFSVLFISSAKSGNNFSDPGKDSVDMLNVFTAKLKDSKVYLNWKVTNVKEIGYFEVERKSPKDKNYESVTKGSDRIKVSEFDDKSTDANSFKVLKFSFENEPTFDGVYFYKLVLYKSSGEKLFASDEIKIGITNVKNFVLEQNHPNPFNPTTGIKYELFDESYVTLKVFDLIGREIATLVDKKEAAGIHSVEFDASKYANLTSGIYFYKLTTEKSSEVKKMILTK